MKEARTVHKRFFIFVMQALLHGLLTAWKRLAIELLALVHREAKQCGHCSRRSQEPIRNNSE